MLRARAHQSRALRVRLGALGLPRLENVETEALTYFGYRHFDPKRGIEAKPEVLEFAVLNDSFREGVVDVAELERVKAQREAARAADKQPNKKRKGLTGDTFKDQNRWRV